MQPKAHQFKFADLNKTVLTDPLKLIAFFEQCQVTNKAAGILKKIDKDKKQLKEKKTAHLPAVCSRESSYQQHHHHKYWDYPIEVTNAITMIANLTIFIETINTTIFLAAKTRTQRAASPTKRRMIASVITSRKRATRPCIMTSPLC
jgi:hypothetical protein